MIACLRHPGHEPPVPGAGNDAAREPGHRGDDYLSNPGAAGRGHRRSRRSTHCEERSMFALVRTWRHAASAVLPFAALAAGAPAVADDGLETGSTIPLLPDHGGSARRPLPAGPFHRRGRKAHPVAPPRPRRGRPAGWRRNAIGRTPMRYDADIASEVSAAVRERHLFPDTTLWGDGCRDASFTMKAASRGLGRRRRSRRSCAPCRMCAVGPWNAGAQVSTSVSRWPLASSGWIGVLSWITRSSSSKKRGPRLEHREAQSGRPVGFEHARLAALDAHALDQQHRDEVDAVAVRAFGRRPADAVGGVDAELVRLDVPRLPPFLSDASAANESSIRRQAGAASTAGVDRLEPALEAAVQRVVFDRLPVRAVRHRLDRAAVGRRSRRGGAAGSGRRRAGRRRAAGRPTTA